MRALIVNCSAPHYNLGARKLHDWLRAEGYAVTYQDGDHGWLTLGYDLVCLSVIFSWHARIALDIAMRVRVHADVWCGGPGVAALGKWWERQTGGLQVVKGLDWRFEQQKGNYRMTFASRGCPVKCWFCVVHIVEGAQFTLMPAFTPAPILCDNNLSALPVEYQEHIITRYRETGTRLGDANSGFEPRTFDEGTYRRWREVLRGPWRFAYDEQEEGPQVLRMTGILAGVRDRMKQVYTLAGNEPVASCYDRAMNVLDWGCEPFCQYVRPLNWLGDPATLRHRHDWSEQLGRDFVRYFNRRFWRNVPIDEYKPRTAEPPPFRGLIAPRRVTVSMASAP